MRPFFVSEKRKNLCGDKKLVNNFLKRIFGCFLISQDGVLKIENIFTRSMYI